MQRALLVILLAAACCRDAAAKERKAEPAAFSDLVIAIVLENIPTEYEDRKHWGKQTKVFDGLKFSGQGLDIKVRKREKSVNHGDWHMYRVTLDNPREHLQAHVTEIRGGELGRPIVSAEITAQLRIHARTARWEKGVQLMSLSTEAAAIVRLRVVCEVGLNVDASRVPPDFLLQPKVTDADVKLIRFNVHKLSKIEGPLAHEIGKSLQDIVADKVAEQSDKIVIKLNKAIAKNEDHLRLSTADLISEQWEQLRKHWEQKPAEK